MKTTRMRDRGLPQALCALGKTTHVAENIDGLVCTNHLRVCASSRKGGGGVIRGKTVPSLYTQFKTHTLSTGIVQINGVKRFFYCFDL